MIKMKFEKIKDKDRIESISFGDCIFTLNKEYTYEAVIKILKKEKPKYFIYQDFFVEGFYRNDGKWYCLDGSDWFICKPFYNKNKATVRWLLYFVN
jgi:hypothetical protein